MQMLLLITAVFLAVINSAISHKILVTTMGVSGSHNLIMYRLADLLGSHGNDVTMMKWIINPNARQPALKYAKEISYPLVKDTTIYKDMEASMNQMAWKKQSIFNIDFSLVNRLNKAAIAGCAEFLNDTTNEVYQRLFTEKYDVMVIHLLDICAYGISELVKNPSRIWMTPAFMPDHMAHYSGVPYPASYVPSGVNAVTDKMSLGERIKNFLWMASIRPLMEYSSLTPMTEIFRQKAGPDFPDFTDLLRQTQLYFINADPFFEYARPTQHNIIYIGGLTMQNADPLSEEWEKIMNETLEEGVVIFSFGTVASTKDMPMAMKTAFIEAFAQFPQYTFLLRMDGELPPLTDNIRRVDWIPQKDLLAHPKIRAFITHGGYNSLTEASYTGVPLVVMPLFGDQVPNGKRVERLGIGASIDKDNFSKESVVEALSKVLNDKSVYDKAKRLSKMIKEKPTSSADLAIRWVEYLAKFKTVDNLLPESRNMGFIQYYSLDVIFMLALIVLFVAFILYSVVRICVSRCRSRFQTHKKTE